ncbi:MAG: thioesterase family protein [Actinomycetota bacterium]|nr:thioesterase family protein [Actinomycetota bacterium]
MLETLQPGLASTLTYEVPVERTVPYLLPESPEFAASPEVLATGYLVAIAEWACLRALNGHLSPGEITLGVSVDLSHEAPTPPGGVVTVDACLMEVDGRFLTFSVLAKDEQAVVCRGSHRRAVVVEERFRSRLSQREPR